LAAINQLLTIYIIVIWSIRSLWRSLFIKKKIKRKFIMLLWAFF